MKAKKIFRLIPFLFILTVPVLFTSCFDYIQSVSFSNGEYHFYYKLTFSKALFAMADMDTDEILDELDLDSMDELEGLSSEINFNTINTLEEVGTEFSFSINPDTQNDDELQLLPKKYRNNKRICLIPFMLGEEGSDYKDQLLEEDESLGDIIAQAMLSTIKCRVYIGKNIVKDISSAYFDGGIYSHDIPFYDLGSVWCLEIPFSSLTDNSCDNSNIIIEMD